VLLGCVIFGLVIGKFFSPLANGRGPHEVIEAWRGKDGNCADGIASNVVDGNLGIGRNEHGRAAMHHSLV